MVFVLGTAGHIDHGKSVLVRSLTGMDPDRLQEEKVRGMTIDLGFAWLKLPSGREVGIVDVPGHERFIKNMLAGVGGIDLALLVIAANEGVRPQTREHLAILDLLEVRNGMVVITKKDLVDDEWLGLVRMEIEELLSSTGLSGAPILAVSAVTGDGLTELISAIDQLLGSIAPRKDIGRPRLPIDRVFTIAGSGTVVTGTLIDGSLSTGQEVEIVPPGLVSRLRGLQMHKAHIQTAGPGSRVAANLVGITTAQLRRGDVLTTPGWLTPTTMLTARLRSLPYQSHPLRHNATVSFHTGADETMARVRLLERDKLEPGETTWVQLLLSNPVAVVKGDGFIIRSPMDTLGGGRVIDAHAKRLRRLPAVIEKLKAREEGTAEEVILALLEQPTEPAALLTHVNLPANEAQPVIEGLIRQGRVVRIGQEKQGLLMTRPGWEHLAQKAISIARDYHHRFPTRAGIPKEELRNKLQSGTHAQAILQRLVKDGVLVEKGAAVHLPTHQVHLSQTQQALIAAFLGSLHKSPYSPPNDLVPEPDLLNLLIERGEVVKVSNSVVFSVSAYNEMVERVTSYIKAQGQISLAEVRDMFNTSRKYAQAFMEHLDTKRITRRVGDVRILY